MILSICPAVPAEITPKTRFVDAPQRSSEHGELAPVGCCTLNDEGLILRANRVAATLLGQDSSALLKQPLRRFIQNDHQDTYDALRQQLIQTGEPQSCELRLSRPDGTSFWAQLQAIFGFDEAGSPLLRVMLSNISERRQVQADLQKSELFKQCILNSIAAEIVVLDPDGIILEVNESWQRFAVDNPMGTGQAVTGAQVGSNYLAAGLSANPLVASDDGHAAGAGIRAVLDGRLPIFSHEYPCHSAQQQRWFSMRVTAMGGATPGGVVITHTDISERKLMEQEREEALSRLQKISSRVPGMVYQYRLRADHSACFPFASDAMREIYQVSPAEVLQDASKVFSVIHPDDHDSVVASILASARDLSPWRQEYRVKLADGTVHWLFGNSLPQREADGSTLWHGFTTDITERKLADDELRAHRAELELGESRQRLRELAAQNESAREGERKHIAREIHDELGQVLTALRMNMSLLSMRLGPGVPTLIDEMQGMKRLVDRAIKGVRHLAMHLRPPALDMGLVPAIEWLCCEFTKSASIPCLLHSHQENIDLDETRAIVVFRIVQESLTNITRYARASQVDIDLSLRGNELWVQVQDDGCGFDLAAAAKRKSFGLLGMRERAIALGGRVDVVSAPGQGTVINVSIPIDSKRGTATS